MVAELPGYVPPPRLARGSAQKRTFPHNLDIEASILGGVILCPELLARLPDLASGTFYHQPHRLIWDAIRNLEAVGSPIDVVTIEHELERMDKLAASGGMNYLGELALRVPTVENVLHYANEARLLQRNRDTIVALGSALERAWTWQHDPSELTSEIAGELQRLDQEARPLGGESRRADLAQALADVRTKLAPTTIAARPELFTDAVDLLDRQFDGPRWLVTGLITRGAITMIGAEPKAAKTWLATEIAVAIATGTRALGEFYAEQGRVAYFYAEDRDVEVRARVRALLAGADRHLERDRLLLQPRGAFLDLLRNEDLALLVQSCRRLGPLDLLVLDPLRDLHSGEEDRSDSMREVMRRLRMLAELLNCTVAVVHHAIKSSKETSKRRPGLNLRGSSAIHGSIDAGLYLSDTGGDETTVFTNQVASQVKGARSAGRFKITLTITDNDAGEALAATWEVERNGGKPVVETARPAAPVVSKAALKKAQDDDRALWFIRSLAKPVSKRALRDHDESPLSEGAMRQAVDRLLETGRCAIQNGVVVPGPPTQLEVVHSG